MEMRVVGCWETAQFPTPTFSTDFDTGHGIKDNNLLAYTCSSSYTTKFDWPVLTIPPTTGIHLQNWFCWSPLGVLLENMLDQIDWKLKAPPPTSQFSTVPSSYQHGFSYPALVLGHPDSLHDFHIVAVYIMVADIHICQHMSVKFGCVRAIKAIAVYHPDDRHCW